MTPIAAGVDNNPSRPARKPLDHTTHYAGRFGATYFLTICCQRRRANQLCDDDIARKVFETAARYDRSERWCLTLLVLMPDHLHMLIAIDADTDLTKLIRDFKRITARLAGIKWQRNFFDHRLRHGESLSEKYAYMIANPVRAGLTSDGEKWPFILRATDVALRRAGD